MNPYSDLKKENERLVALLEEHNIDWRVPKHDALDGKKDIDFPSGPSRSAVAAPVCFSTEQKVRLFRRLFLGRTDVFPMRWESKKGDRSGYAPACANEWKAGVCEKPRIKCGACQHRQLVPLSDQAIYDHLSGAKTLGVYPLLSDNSCHFLAVDFDKSSWQEDVLGFVASCRKFSVEASIEVSRSGNGAHVWIFFDRAVLAREARQLGTALISYTCNSHQQLDLASYDRMFPNQDFLPKGGFGNLIALPLQKAAREKGFSVFVDDELQPIDDQWGYLASLPVNAGNTLDAVVLMASGVSHPLDVSFIDQEDRKEPWSKLARIEAESLDDLPSSLNITVSDRIYVGKEDLPQPLLNRIIRLAAFQNPEFYKAQAMRFSVWNKPRVIACAENFPFHIAIPRGCLEPLLALMKAHNIVVRQDDKRYAGKTVGLAFTGKLRSDQEIAVKEMLRHDCGILCAPTAFGKTVVAAAILARRGVNTLILVHRSELLDQWLERLQAFLSVEKGDLGQLGGGKKQTTGVVDIALVQSLSRKGVVKELVQDYGHVIIDECHHVGASSIESILRTVKAKYVIGLTATPVRRDGQQPIIFMQCGPIRHTATRSPQHELQMTVEPNYLEVPLAIEEGEGIQQVFGRIVNDQMRNQAIASVCLKAWRSGGKVLVLTERTDHLQQLLPLLSGEVAPYVLHGKIPKKERAETLTALNQLDADKPRLLLATGKLIGEGFDHSALDTLVLAMPISWKGTLQQYVGRLHRVHQDKVAVKVIDFVDLGHPALVRMWERRQRGYRALGYVIDQSASS